MSRFGFCSSDVKYRLFKSHCVIAYGSQLWDFGNPSVAAYFTEWRKAVRRIWALPNCAHCHLLPGVCDDLDIESQLLSRSLNLIRSSLVSKNSCLVLCARLAFRASGSAVSNTLVHMCELAGVSRHQLCFSNVEYFRTSQPIPNHASTIREFSVGSRMVWGDDLSNYLFIIHELSVK